MKKKEDQIQRRNLKWPPLSGDYIVGNSKSSVAVVTCGSYDLPRRVVELRAGKIAIAGFCETENEGLAKIIQNIVSNPTIRNLVVCGERVKGHEPGQTILALHMNGIDDKNLVIGSTGTIPALLPTYFRGDSPLKYVHRFQQQITHITDLIGETSPEKIAIRIDEISADPKSVPLEMEPIFPPQPKPAYDWEKAVVAHIKNSTAAGGRGRNSLGSMFTFAEAKPRIYDLCGVKVGGQRGEYPTVMAGTIFYARDKTVIDPKTGDFDKKTAADLIHRQDEASLRYSLPVMVHIVGQSNEAIERYLLFVIDHTDSPIILDSSSIDVRIHGIKLAKDIGIEDRAIYNSIVTANSEERDGLSEIGGIKYAICLSFEESAQDSVRKTKKSLTYFKNIIENPIIDPGVPRIGSGALSALERAWILKNKFGFPTAIGIHNAHSALRIREDAKFDFDYTLPTLFGIDINLYGPIKNADKILPCVAAADAAVADEINKVFKVLPRRPHPYYRVLGEGDGFNDSSNGSLNSDK